MPRLAPLLLAAIVASACGSTPTNPLVKPHVAEDFNYTLVRVPGSFGASATLVDRADKAGDLVGRYLVGTGTEWHGFLRRNGSFQSMEMPGASRTLAHGINDSGDVVGRYFVGTVEHAFTFSKGAYTSYDMPGASGTRFYDISGIGAIAGSYKIGTGSWQPMVWSNGTFKPLPTLMSDVSANMAEAFGIDADGSVVGHFTIAGDAKMYGFLYREGSHAVTLNQPGSSTGAGAMSCAWGSGNGGEIVGHYTDPAAGGVTGFIWSGGQFVGKVRVPGATETYPQAITSSGLIAGYASLASGERVGFTATLK